MRITGRDIASAALDYVLQGADEAISDIDSSRVLVSRSRFVLDSLNQDPLTSVGAETRYDVPLAINQDAFTWGPGGDVDAHIPTTVRSWSVIDTTGVERTRGSLLVNVEQWSALRAHHHDSQHEAEFLYWERTLNDARYTFHVLPPSSREQTIRLYARVPKLDLIDLGTTYDLDPGRAAYLVTALAIDCAPVWGFPIPPALYAVHSENRRRLADRNEETPFDPMESRYGIGLDRAFFGWW